MTMPATASELQKLLEQRNLYPWYAAANGTNPHDGYALKREGDRWVVYRYGLGAIPNKRAFLNEQEAVTDLVERLRNDAFAGYLKDL